VDLYRPGMSGAEVLTTFEERVEPVIVELATGEVVEEGMADVPADYDQRAAYNKPALVVKVPENVRRDYGYPLAQEVRFAQVYLVKNEEGIVDRVVLPIRGAGLWGTMWGFLALSIDREEEDPSERFQIAGITYYEHKETPGLGGEVDRPSWKDQWSGLIAYKNDWSPQVSVKKGASLPSEVDALAGATITSNGVEAMVNYWLSGEGFGKFLQNFEQRDLLQTAMR
jgi:Na+-transporting NADH:ubiquinone oxidoreductase subunit C